MSFHISRIINQPFNDALLKLKELLHKEDYLIATEIDVQGALKQRLDADLPQIYIIGTNTPKVGFQLFNSDPKLGTLLPFSIVLHELEENSTQVTMIDPEWLFRSVDIPSIVALGTEVKSTFTNILNGLQRT